jgi:hypothetical protein
VYAQRSEHGREPRVGRFHFDDIRPRPRRSQGSAQRRLRSRAPRHPAVTRRSPAADEVDDLENISRRQDLTWVLDPRDYLAVALHGDRAFG